MIVRDQTSVFKLLFSWRGTILPKVLPPLGVVMLLSTVIGGLSYFNIFHFPELPLVGFTLIGVVLSIFLGFKNSACYDRWWEARRLWGILIANARHFDRDCRMLSQGRRERVIQHVIVFANVLRDRLRHDTANPTELIETSGMSAQAIKQLYQQVNAPQYTLSLMQWELMQALKEGEISDIIYAQMNDHIMELSTVQTGCDRIATTPLPFAYSVLLNRTVYFFCFMLPFSLGSTLGLVTPLLVGILAYTFLGLDALSSEIEEPFGTQSNDLPLDSMVRTIEIELLGTLGKPTPPPIQAHDNNLL
ncbi:bestrophin [Acinetobacter cumulans]|jgi:putative membrane protein|uniref:Bestrophin n=1 Tax=Acinetobacter cumulans TaxID=2136182 RepID=A0A3A8G4M0_9GAMM|nr:MULTISPECIES: bestrophin family protein [Acinetobacter]NWK75018.1 bestrophin [Acinetobacter sp. SwsAc6]QCO20296.1 bestrophin [Acinetobacter cumulans]RFS31674.1 bestrophin [Acinetobacter sp. SWAC5]RKG45537.1 bestrophin [Acinetobacter cumulans]RKG45672.1 bestrophin [Acinetobacter cumulans]